jgi:hypothetical protein
MQVPLLGHCDALLLALHLLTAAYCGIELLVSRYVGEKGIRGTALPIAPRCPLPSPHPTPLFYRARPGH